jgi:hypothetical protein
MKHDNEELLNLDNAKSTYIFFLDIKVIASTLILLLEINFIIIKGLHDLHILTTLKFI